MSDALIQLKSAHENNAINQVEGVTNIISAIKPIQKIIPIFDNATLQKIQEQILQKQNQQQSEIKVCFTQDGELLNQYYELRHKAYNVENGWQTYDGSENEYDRHGKIVVAIKDGKVIGGMRLIVSDCVDYFPNDRIGTEFTYKNFLQKYDLDSNALFCEISAFTVEKNNRDSTISTKMFEFGFPEMKKLGCKYILGVAGAIVCRNYRKEINRLGYNVKIVNEFPWVQEKHYGYIQPYPIIVTL